MALCAASLSTTGAAQTTEKLVAIHHSENMYLKDTTFAYDPCGNVVLRMTDDWREENAYDSEGRLTERKIYEEYRGEMKLESEQIWAFDEENHTWMEEKHRNNEVATRIEHWYDEAGRDTLVNTYNWNAASETWSLKWRTLTTFGDYGMTCQLTQYMEDGQWVNSQRTVAEYQGSGDSYKLTQEYYLVWDSSDPDSGEWKADNAYEYNYLRQNNTLRIWGYEEDHHFDDEYTFDAQGRIVSHKDRYASTRSSETTTYEYDAQGNLVDVTETEYWSDGITSANSHRYTYDDNGAILTAEYLVRDEFGTSFVTRSTTVYDYDTSVPASAVFGCPSAHYKLLSVTETDKYGNVKVTTYEYAPVDETNGIRQTQSHETHDTLPCYDLTGRPTGWDKRSHIYRKGDQWLTF